MSSPITIYDNVECLTGTALSVGFKDMASWLGECHSGGKSDVDFDNLDDYNKNANAFIRCLMGKGDRTLKSVQSGSSYIMIDGDKPARGTSKLCTPYAYHKHLKGLGINHIIYTSHSHSKTANKFRCIIPTNKPYEAHECEYQHRKANKEIGKVGWVSEMGNFVQLWFTPRREDANDGLFKHYSYTDGKDWEIENVEESKTEDEEKKTESEKESTRERGDDLDTMYENIRTGKEYHESLRTISYQYIKDGMSAANCKSILRTMLDGSVDAGSERWTTRYRDIDRLVDGAVARKEGEKEVGEAPEARVGIDIPVFPYGIVSTWPEPWPQIYKAYSDVARDPVEELLVPTMLSNMAYFLNNNYLTGQGKNLNLIFLNLADSGVGKDANTTSITRELSRVFQRRDVKMPDDPFLRFSEFNKSLTSDTAFMECFNDDGNFYWVNTEATRIFELIGSKGNSSVSAISDKLVEVGDGGAISTKKKAGQKEGAPRQDNPNCQVLLCAQPDTIKDHLNSSMIDSGLFGRPLISISGRCLDLDEYDMFSDKSPDDIELSEDMMNFFSYIGRLEKFGTGQIFRSKVIRPSKEDTIDLNKWQKENLIPHMKREKTLETILKRMAIPIEQVFTIVNGVVIEYAKFKSVERERVQARALFPLLDFWAECKVYAASELVNAEADPLGEAIVDIMRDILVGKIKMSKVGHANAVKEGRVPTSRIASILGNRTKLLKTMGIDGKGVGMGSRVNLTISALVELGALVKCSVGSTKCVAFPSE